MRKLLSIPLIVLILFSGLTVNIATHYCGGDPVASLVSLSGELANCGMESGKTEKTTQESLTNHCCDNVLSSFSFKTNYIPSFSSLNNQIHHIADVNYLLSDNSTLKDNFNIISKEVIRPPGIWEQSNSEQEILCIFRI